MAETSNASPCGTVGFHKYGLELGKGELSISDMIFRFALKVLSLSTVVGSSPTMAHAMQMDISV
jgi:hypothetical protein